MALIRLNTVAINLSRAEAGLADGPWDAVYLSLHGAYLADGVASADVALLTAVREAIGDTPLGASFDLHANLDPAVVALVDATADLSPTAIAAGSRPPATNGSGVIARRRG